MSRVKEMPFHHGRSQAALRVLPLVQSRSSGICTPARGAKLVEETATLTRPHGRSQWRVTSAVPKAQHHTCTRQRSHSDGASDCSYRLRFMLPQMCRCSLSTMVQHG